MKQWFGNEIVNRLKGAAISLGLVIASLSLDAVATRAAASPSVVTETIEEIIFGDGDVDILDILIALDGAEIDELRQSLADLRSELELASYELKDARQDALAETDEDEIVNLAFQLAGLIFSRSANAAFDEIKHELDRAELRLLRGERDISSEEMEETTSAIDMIRVELAEIERTLDELLAELNAA